MRRAIGQYAYRSRYIYIGSPQQRPEARFTKHQQNWAPGHKWDRMIVIYKSRTFSLMQTVEDKLIKYAEQRIAEGSYNCVLINDRNSQRPMVSKNLDAYWIYILTQA